MITALTLAMLAICPNCPGASVQLSVTRPARVVQYNVVAPAPAPDASATVQYEVVAPATSVIVQRSVVRRSVVQYDVGVSLGLDAASTWRQRHHARRAARYAAKAAYHASRS
jgi:hypothetical protein